MKPIQLLYCGNDESYEEILLSLLSVMCHSSRSLQVILLTACLDRYDGKPISWEKADYLNGLLKSRGEQNGLTLIDLTSKAQEQLSTITDVRVTDSPYPLLALLTDQIFDALAEDKLLYLDKGTIAAADIGRIFDADMGTSAYGGVRDQYAPFFLLGEYISGGALLFDLKNAKEQHLFEKAREICQGNECLDPLPTSLYLSDCTRTFFKSNLNEQRCLKSDTVVSYYGNKARFLPVFHFERQDIRKRSILSKKERAFFSGVYDQFYLYRDGYREGGTVEEKTSNNLTERRK